MSVATLAGAYFACVFAIGFALGVIRTLLLAPALGERAAELAELPVMVLASWLVASALMRGIGRRLGVAGAVAAGAAALALLVGAEILVVFLVRAQSLGDYVAARDPVAFGAYVLALLLFAAMPAAIARSRERKR